MRHGRERSCGWRANPTFIARRLCASFAPALANIGCSSFGFPGGVAPKILEGRSYTFAGADVRAGLPSGLDQSSWFAKSLGVRESGGPVRLSFLADDFQPAATASPG